MPELPEVDVVRAGLEKYVLGRTVREVAIFHPRAIRRHVLGERDFAANVVDRKISAVRRRGKYLWLELEEGPAVLAHLGMSGQMLMQPEEAPAEKHLRIRVRFADDGPELRFVDQRTFGGFTLSELVHVDKTLLPQEIAHIGRDPMDPQFDRKAAVTAIRSRRTEIKRALLDQTLVSGIGNIYADEALWRVRLHWSTSTQELTAIKVGKLLDAAHDVMAEALQAGGTSFDALYVNVNGQSGYFDRSLNAYGQENRPCPRCGTPIQRQSFMNRSSFFCPRCQRN